MLSKLLTQIRKYDMLAPGDTLICAVSGGADSMALLWAMYLLREKLLINLEAAHFNHGLRGEESDRDEAFVRDFCTGYGIRCHVGSGVVQAGKKGLEAAARDARYGFFSQLHGKIATAHTADDNAETLLMHLVRGTGLKGLGGITPVTGHVIRPMLTVSREQVLEFLQEYHISFVEDSSNRTDAFLRNRLRHHVMPLLKNENPRLVENLSAMAMELREDAAALEPADVGQSLQVSYLRRETPAIRRRILAAYLTKLGVREPERSHIELAEKLVFSQNPSASAEFPGKVILHRSYDLLLGGDRPEPIPTVPLTPGTSVQIPGAGVIVSASPWQHSELQKDSFVVAPVGQMVIRCRRSGDEMRLSGGTKSLKKLFIDRKIPENKRLSMVVIADDLGVLGVQGIGANLDRIAEQGVRIQFENIEQGGSRDDQ